MLTHFSRRQKKISISTKTDSIIESLALQSFPLDKLVILNEAYNNFIDICQKNKEKVASRSIFEDLVTLLVEKRFLIELTSQKLDKFLDSF